MDSRDTTTPISVQIPQSILDQIAGLLAGELFLASRHALLQAAIVQGFPAVAADPIDAIRRLRAALRAERVEISAP
jgi:hypothetical protein